MTTKKAKFLDEVKTNGQGAVNVTARLIKSNQLL
jgi:hypothetical protein